MPRIDIHPQQKVFARPSGFGRLAGGLFAAALPMSVLAAATNNPPATVTAAMGDVGGKLFGRAPDPARTRHYYVAAETQAWDFAPAGRDVICGKPLPPAIVSRRAATKVRYVEYTDATFTRRVPPNPALGILGPVLRGVVGDYIAVTFLNRGDTPWVRENLPFSIHPHGVKYDKDNEGSYYQPNPGLGAAIAPGAKFTYVWQLDENSGPLPSEPSSKAWLYHSHVQGDDEVNLGLVGFLIVTDPKRAQPDGTPIDVDRELASLFMIFNESGLDADAAEAEEHARIRGEATTRSWAELQQFNEEGERYAINGYIFGNLPGLEMNAGERVRWYLFGLGSEQDFHTAHWHGLTVVESGRRADVVELLPASMKIADMVADNPGSWLFHCHVAEHMAEGMFAHVTVHPRDGDQGKRAPQPAFLGLPRSRQTLQISRVEAMPSGGPQPGEIKIEGSVAVPEAFPVFAHPVLVQLGDRALTFHPDRTGLAEAAGARFQAINPSRNSSEYGVVYGGLMQFELQLSSDRGTRDAKPGASGAGRDLPVTLAVEIAGTWHRAEIQLPAGSR